MAKIEDQSVRAFSNIDIRSLFVDCAVQKHVDDIDLVFQYKKPMSFFVFDEEQINDLIKDERWSDPSILLINCKNRDTRYTFVCREGESWRVPAYIKFKQVMENYKWSDAAEHYESSLLGYSEAEIYDWLSVRRKTHGFWGLQTVYALMTKKNRALMQPLGDRCFSPYMSIEECVFFFDAGRRCTVGSLKSTLSDEAVLLRFAISLSALRKMFDVENYSNSQDGIIILKNGFSVEDINSEIASDIQFLG